MIPVPSTAGIKRIRAALNLRSTGCGMLPFTSGIRIIARFAADAAFFTAACTSAALPVPSPTFPLRLPMTTMARNLMRRPPFTTRVTRSTERVCSAYSLGSRWRPPRLRSGLEVLALIKRIHPPALLRELRRAGRKQKIHPYNEAWTMERQFFLRKPDHLLLLSILLYCQLFYLLGDVN